ncbi:hypothetical protein HETIRDRAFT_388419 [Heterobasidion irregulare TC 32-1]|uniref:Uncharacterized protein n=1 Tax=Heterobasidion irregulare (strain TC 32-1) TaxID=747525 RepID=W4JXV2_HETIT|nr:uncharacterized protein HETIRDRAFT_388419 [Heterobasidion irregulare TC 32-1]ETW78363.1 hypothetical protein HETIRDRAFT_388419 [Heterobasidion irregulare TC 32-1]
MSYYSYPHEPQPRRRSYEDPMRTYVFDTIAESKAWEGRALLLCHSAHNLAILPPASTPIGFWFHRFQKDSLNARLLRSRVSITRAQQVSNALGGWLRN